IGRHHESVSTHAHNHQQIAFTHFRHLPIECEEIARFAHWPNDVDLLFLRAHVPALTRREAVSFPYTPRLIHRHNLVIAVVKRRPDQIVHARIDNHEFFLGSLFDVTDLGEQYARVAHKKTTGLNQDPNAKVSQRWHIRLRVIADAKCG